VCVWVCVGVYWVCELQEIYTYYLCVCIRMYAYICVCMRKYAYVCIYMCSVYIYALGVKTLGVPGSGDNNTVQGNFFF
jgi:hypothetical protein